MSQNRTITILIVIIILLLGVIGFFLVNTFVSGFHPVESVEYKELDQEKAALNEDYLQTLNTLDSANVEINQLVGYNDYLDSVIISGNERRDSLKREVMKILGDKQYTQSQLNKANNLIQKLKEENQFFVDKINTLMDENEELAGIRDQLEKDLAAEKTKVQSLSQEKDELSGKVALGSLLQTNNLSASGVKFKNSGKEVETDKIKKVEKIKVCYDTGDNKVREQGDVTMYLRIVSPQGTTVYVEAMGSGVLKKANSDEEVKYTKKVTFDYASEDKRICIYWSEQIIDAGTYDIEIYQDGHMVGNTSLELN